MCKKYCFKYIECVLKSELIFVLPSVENVCVSHHHTCVLYSIICAYLRNTHACALNAHKETTQRNALSEPLCSHSHRLYRLYGAQFRV